MAESDKEAYVNQGAERTDLDTTAAEPAAPVPDPHAELSARFRAAVEPDFRYCDTILEAAKVDPVTEALVLAYLALPADPDLRSRLILSMGMRQGELARPRQNVSGPEPYFHCYGYGLVCSSVCTNLPPEEAAERLNAEYPTGISSRWKLSEDTAFADGTPIPAPCPDAPDRKHYLFNC